MVDFDGDEPTVREIMSHPPITIRRDATVHQAALLLRQRNIHGLIVVDKEKKSVEGILTDKDIVSKVVAENKPPREVKVEDVMSTKIIFADREDLATRIAEVMYANGIMRMPVKDGDGHLVGIVTSSDVNRVLPALAEADKKDYQVKSTRFTREQEKEKEKPYTREDLENIP